MSAEPTPFDEQSICPACGAVATEFTFRGAGSAQFRCGECESTWGHGLGLPDWMSRRFA